MLTEDNNVEKAFKECRNIDPLSSYGDFIAISDIIDFNTAEKIKNVVSDGIIALGYTDDALDILKRKKKGKYIIFKADYVNYFYEARELNGLKFVYETNKYILNNNKMIDILFKNNLEYRIINQNLQKDIQLAHNILMYVPSNSISISYNNKVIGVGAGQQNRVDCIKIAGRKAMEYLKRNDIHIDDTELVMSSDGFLPFEDNIDDGIKYNIKYIIQPGGSIRDEFINKKCKENNITMIKTGFRMFYH